MIIYSLHAIEAAAKAFDLQPTAPFAVRRLPAWAMAGKFEALQKAAVNFLWGAIDGSPHSTLRQELWGLGPNFKVEGSPPTRVSSGRLEAYSSMGPTLTVEVSLPTRLIRPAI